MIDVIGLILVLLGLGLIAFYIVPKQILAITGNTKDWLTTLRWQLLISFAAVLLASVPGIIIRVLRSLGVVPPEWLIEITKITSSLSVLIFAIVWAMIYRYRDKR